MQKEREDCKSDVWREGDRERVFFKEMAGMEGEREERACMERERERESSE